MGYINGGSVIAIGVLFPLLDSLAVAGRFYSRIKRRTANIGADDWTCVPALGFTVACGILLVYGSAQRTIGYHTTEPTSHEDAEYQKGQIALMDKLELVFEMISVLAIGLIKLAILLCYRRIFTGRTFSIVNGFMIGLVVAWMVTFLIASITACGKHINYLWGTYADYSASCIDTFVLTMALAVTDFVIDLMILTEPLPWIWRLQMTTRRKVAISGVFLTGAFATAAAITRTVVIIEIYTFNPDSNGNIFGMPGNLDQLGINSVFFFWSYIEVGVAMALCCAPSLRLLLDQFSLQSILSSIRDSSPFRSQKTTPAVSTSSGRKSSNTSSQQLVLNPEPTFRTDIEMVKPKGKPKNKSSVFGLHRFKQNRNSSTEHMYAYSQHV